MGIRDTLTREHVVNGLKNLGKLRVTISHGSILTVSALLVILFIAFTIRILPLRWEIDPTAGKSNLHLSEFDPYFQYRFTEYIVKNGFFSWIWPTEWVDTQRWYPNGINVARAGYPGLPMTTAFLYEIITALGVNIGLMDFCAVFPAIFGMLACLAIYFVGKDYGGKSIGMFAALFLALSPSYLQRTSLGFFDDETIGIFAFLVFMMMFLRSIEGSRSLGSSVKYAVGSGLALGYFSASWGAAYYPVDATVLFVFVLILLRRYSQKLLLSYSLTFGLGLFISMNVPRLAPVYITTIPILPVLGVLVLLCLYEVSKALTGTKLKVTFIVAFLSALVIGFGLLWQMGLMRDIAGKFWSVIDPFMRATSPLTESVAEHRISAWGSIYYEFGVMILFFAVGFFFIVRNLSDRNLFLLLLGLTSLYFASSMVRLLVLIAPIFALLAAIGVIGILKPFNTLLKEPPKIFTKKKYSLEHVGREFSGTAIFLIFLLLMTNFAFSPQSGGPPKVYRQAYTPIIITASSLPITPNQPIPEWLDMLDWMKNNLDSSTVVASWWDYGYWLTVMGNVTSLADNATINSTQIENVGFSFMANETNSLKMLKLYNAKYILVFTTLALGTSGSTTYAQWAGYGDEGKWMWMAKISGKAHDRFINNGFIKEQDAWVDETAFGQYNSTQNRWIWNSTGMNSTVYKLMSYGKQRWCDTNSVSNTDTSVQPVYFEEAYFAGLSVSADDAKNYGNLVPLICLYKVNYPSGS
jgi:dolichyl-diphosphooligosaccharide--protein glycosyltransferase